MAFSSLRRTPPHVFPGASEARSASLAGVGGQVGVRTLEARDFAIGSIVFPRWPFLATLGSNSAFEGEDYDGLIGQDVLRYFTVYLDYPHGRIALVPNSRYAARFQ